MIKLGCFGSVIALNPKSATCKACPVMRECRAQVKETESETLNLIERYETKRETEEATLFAKQRHKIEDLPEAAFHKVKRYFARRDKQYDQFVNGKPQSRQEADYRVMLNNGINFIAIREGKNPFRGCRYEKYKYMEHAVDFFIDHPYILRADIADYYRQVGYGSSASSRKTQASKAIKILVLAGIMKEDGGVYCLA